MKTPRPVSGARGWSALIHPGGASLRQLGKDMLQSISDDDIAGRSSQLAYYFFFSLFPGFIFLSSLPGLLTGPGSGLRDSLMQHLALAVPPQAFGLLQQTLNGSNHQAGKLTFGAVVALWSATVGMAAACDTLNGVHDVKEGRPWWRVRITALILTLVTTVLLVGAFVVLFAGDAMIHRIGHAGYDWPLMAAIQGGRWAIAFFLMALLFGIVYYFAPDVKERKWHWLTPGAALGIVLWVLATIALRVYLHYFDSYSVTFGAVGAVMIMLLWFYIAGFALLTGAEINAVIENAAAQEGDATATAKGEKAPKAA